MKQQTVAEAGGVYKSLKEKRSHKGRKGHEDVPEGYKRTEVGVIPEDWEQISLEQIASIIGGGTPSTVNPHFWGGGIDWYTPSEIGESKYLNHSLRRITREGMHNSSAKLLPVGTVLFTSRATIGELGILKKEATTNQGFQSVVPKPNMTTTEFLYYRLHTLRRLFVSLSSGSTFLEINPSKLKSIQIPSPPLPEQKAIARVLSDTDALIEALNKLIAKKKAIKQGAMQELLTGKRRLPGFGQEGKEGRKGSFHQGRKGHENVPEGYKRTEVGVIPEDWEVVTIHTISTCKAGGTPNTSREDFWNGNIPWMSSGELHKKRIFSVIGRISKLGYSNSSTHMIMKDSVLIGLAGQGKTRGTVALNKIELCTNQSIAAILPSSNHDSEYLFYHLDNRYDELRTLSTGDGGRGGLNLKIIGNLQISLPALSEQQAIATVLIDIDSDIEALERKRDKYKQIKEGMMEQLLTGKVRLV